MADRASWSDLSAGLAGIICHDHTVELDARNIFRKINSGSLGVKGILRTVRSHCNAKSHSS